MLLLRVAHGESLRHLFLFFLHQVRVHLFLVLRTGQDRYFTLSSKTKLRFPHPLKICQIIPSFVQSYLMTFSLSETRPSPNKVYLPPGAPIHSLVFSPATLTLSDSTTAILASYLVDFFCLCAPSPTIRQGKLCEVWAFFPVLLNTKSSTSGGIPAHSRYSVNIS